MCFVIRPVRIRVKRLIAFVDLEYQLEQLISLELGEIDGRIADSKFTVTRHFDRVDQ